MKKFKIWVQGTIVGEVEAGTWAVALDKAVAVWGGRAWVEEVQNS